MSSIDPKTATQADFDPIAYINEPRWQQVSLGLGRTYELLERLGNPQDCLKFVHVAGTNGKGSTCAFTAEILQQAGYKVGLFTSPYIITFEERIRVDGVNIPYDRLHDITLKVKAAAEAMSEHPTEFELMTAVGFKYFAEEACDICVVEVGLGGRLDSTNIIASPEVCVITPIALDHTGMLGDTLGAIAGEKAGIIKPGCPVVSAAQEPEAREVIERVAAENGCPIRFVDLAALSGGVDDFTYRSREHLQSSLLGSYQIENAALAIEIADALAEVGWNVSDADVRAGLANTRWPGRFERVRRNPDVIIDGGHNPQGATALARSLDDVYPGRKVHFIVGILADKDYRTMLHTMLPYAASVTTVTPPSPRALDAADLAAAAVEAAGDLGIAVAAGEGAAEGVAIQPAESYEAALAALAPKLDAEDVVCMCGSLYAISHELAALETVDLW